MEAPAQAPAPAGFAVGAAVGALLALTALLLFDAQGGPDAGSGHPLVAWVALNLGHSVWLFALVLAMYGLHIGRLRRLLAAPAGLRPIVELDQLTDVWINLFIGIGVIWTAVGMRNALTAALGDPGAALNDSAGSVLEKLVDGGILLALTTTIVGGVGSYLMRLAKTMTVGAALMDFYDRSQRRELQALLESCRAIESRLGAIERAQPVAPERSA